MIDPGYAVAAECAEREQEDEPLARQKVRSRTKKASRSAWVNSGRRRARRKKLEQLQKAERVININRMIRALSDIVAAEKPDYARLGPLALGASSRRNSTRTRTSRNSSTKTNPRLKDLTSGGTLRSAAASVVMSIAREIRNESLKKNDQEVIAMLKTMRGESYETVKRICENWMKRRRLGTAFADVRPFEREFMRYYWGALAMVESRQVEGAMVEFKDALDGLGASRRMTRPGRGTGSGRPARSARENWKARSTRI